MHKSGGEEKPLCYHRECDASELMIHELDVWMHMLYLVKSELFMPRALDLLREAGATNGDLQVFAWLNGRFYREREKMGDALRHQEQMRRAVTGAGRRGPRVGG